ncbi:MAG: hypothetical protein V8R50_04190 [Clostridia bacterium]
MVNDEFLYSKVEQYAPTVLTVEDKINYKTYLKWNIPASIPEDITYEVYRGTDKDFFPDEEHRIAQDLKTGYFTEINVDFSRDYYYKVCAVKKGVDHREPSMRPEAVSRMRSTVAPSTRTNSSSVWAPRTTGNSPNSTRRTAMDSSRRARAISCISKKMRRSRTKASM